jgi:DNA-binding response OmpR family regulator
VEVALRARELRRDGKPVPLGAKEFALLAFLVTTEHRRRSKETA